MNEAFGERNILFSLHVQAFKCFKHWPGTMGLFTRQASYVLRSAASCSLPGSTLPPSPRHHPPPTTTTTQRTEKHRGIERRRNKGFSCLKFSTACQDPWSRMGLTCLLSWHASDPCVSCLCVQIEPYLPYEFTCEGMLQRVNAFIENQVETFETQTVSRLRFCHHISRCPITIFTWLFYYSNQFIICFKYTQWPLTTCTIYNDFFF